MFLNKGVDLIHKSFIPFGIEFDNYISATTDTMMITRDYEDQKL